MRFSNNGNPKKLKHSLQKLRETCKTNYKIGYVLVTIKDLEGKVINPF